MTAALPVCPVCRQPTLPAPDGHCLWCRDEQRLGPGWHRQRLIPQVRPVAEDERT